MLRIVVPATQAIESWDEEKEEFVVAKSEKEQPLQLEHSLVSLSKWESKWCKTFFSTKEKTEEEVVDYVKCMTMTANVDPGVYSRLSKQNLEDIKKYIEAPMTATYFSNDKNVGRSREAITSELIYYWMIALNIPFECQKWHLNRLLTLIRVCNIKNTPPKKMSKRAIMSRNSALNASRRQQLGSKG